MPMQTGSRLAWIAFGLGFATAGAFALAVLLHHHGLEAAVAVLVATAGVIGLTALWVIASSRRDRDRSGPRIVRIGQRIGLVGFVALLASVLVQSRDVRPRADRLAVALGLADAPVIRARPPTEQEELEAVRRSLEFEARVDALRRQFSVIARRPTRLATAGPVDLQRIVVRRSDALEVEVTAVAKQPLTKPLWLDLAVTCRDGERRPSDSFFGVFHFPPEDRMARHAWRLFRGHPELATAPCELRWSMHVGGDHLATACLTGSTIEEGPCPAMDRESSEVEAYALGVEFDGPDEGLHVSLFGRLGDTLPPDRRRLGLFAACRVGDAVRVESTSFPIEATPGRDPWHRFGLFTLEHTRLATAPSRCSIAVDHGRSPFGGQRTWVAEACWSGERVVEGPCVDLRQGLGRPAWAVELADLTIDGDASEPRLGLTLALTLAEPTASFELVADCRSGAHRWQETLAHALAADDLRWYPAGSTAVVVATGRSRPEVGDFPDTGGSAPEQCRIALRDASSGTVLDAVCVREGAIESDAACD